MTSITKKSGIKEFTVSCGELRVTDPCYTPDAWCAGVLPAVNGVYHAQIGISVEENDLRSATERVESIKRKLESAPTGADSESMTVRWMLEGDLRDAERNLKDVKKGRPVYIMVAHESVKDRALGMFDVGHIMTDGVQDGWKLSTIHVGVDSGQAGFFDAASYASQMADAEDGGNMGPLSSAFYENIIRQTLPSRSADVNGDGLAITPFGCASLTFHGDGGYSCYTLLGDDDRVLAAYILFDAAYEGDEEDAA